MKNKLYVVEGLHDEMHLQNNFPNIKTVSLGGLQINKDKLNFLIENQDRFEIILVFDPDHPGDKIRRKVSEKLNNPTHIFINRKDAKAKNNKKIGLEHVSPNKLKTLINYEVKEKNEKAISILDLYDLGLTTKAEAKNNRNIIESYYHIGKTNTKTLIKRLNWLGVTKNELKEVLNNAASI